MLWGVSRASSLWPGTPDHRYQGVISRPDGWVIDKKMERIIPLEFKRTPDASETYYTDMEKTADTQHVLCVHESISKGLF